MLHKSKIKRAKPLLGTYVEITLYSDSLSEEQLLSLSNKCFDLIKDVQSQMSFFESDSDIGRLNQAQANEKIIVSQSTYMLLKFAQDLSEESNFDILYLDRSSFPNAKLIFEDENIVSKNHPFRIDLGGIAKGYAVDKVSDLLEKFSGVSGVINAGGDIRFVGEEFFPLVLRSPIDDRKYIDVGKFKNCAVATSKFKNSESVTVISDRCFVSDSLTKAIYQSEDSGTLLRKYSAKAININSKEMILYEA